MTRRRFGSALRAVARLRWLKLDPAVRLAHDIAFNERMIREHQRRQLHPFGMRPTFEMAQRLRPHPTIQCHFSRPLGEGFNSSSAAHGFRQAVARRDMRVPYCAGCMIEDPYE